MLLSEINDRGVKKKANQVKNSERWTVGSDIVGDSIFIFKTRSEV